MIDPIRLGHSPDPDDAFMFYGLAREQVDAEGLRFEHRLEDIETLNQRAFRGELEVTALSVHAYTHLTERYVLLKGQAVQQGHERLAYSWSLLFEFALNRLAPLRGH